MRKAGKYRFVRRYVQHALWRLVQSSFSQHCFGSNSYWVCVSVQKAFYGFFKLYSVDLHIVRATKAYYSHSTAHAKDLKAFRTAGMRLFQFDDIADLKSHNLHNLTPNPEFIYILFYHSIIIL